MLEDEPDLTVVGEAGDGEEAIKLAKSLKPQVVVMDCALPKVSGLAATKKNFGGRGRRLQYSS